MSYRSLAAKIVMGLYDHNLATKIPGMLPVYGAYRLFIGENIGDLFTLYSSGRARCGRWLTGGSMDA